MGQSSDQVAGTSGGHKRLRAGETYSGLFYGFSPETELTLTSLIDAQGNEVVDAWPYVAGMYYPAKGMYKSITVDTGDVLLYLDIDRD